MNDERVRSIERDRDRELINVTSLKNSRIEDLHQRNLNLALERDRSLEAKTTAEIDLQRLTRESNLREAELQTQVKAQAAAIAQQNRDFDRSAAAAAETHRLEREGQARDNAKQVAAL